MLLFCSYSQLHPFRSYALLISIKDCGSEAKTADYCANILKIDIELIKRISIDNNVSIFNSIPSLEAICYVI